MKQKFVLKSISAFLLMFLTITSIGCRKNVPLDEDPPIDELPGITISKHVGPYDYLNPVKTVYFYDFSQAESSYYAKDKAITMVGRSNCKFDGSVYKIGGRSAAFITSNYCLGDDYGVVGGTMSAKYLVNGGTGILGIRLTKYGLDDTHPGIYLYFSPNEVNIIDNTSDINAKMPLVEPLTTEHVITVKDDLDLITILENDKILATFDITKINYETSSIVIKDGNGNEIARTEKSKINPCGHVAIGGKMLDGYIDDFSYENTAYDYALPESENKRLIDYTTWTATDDLNRKTADNKVAGDVKNNKYVGLFYFIHWVQHGPSVLYAQDHTKQYLEMGLSSFRKFYIDKKGGEGYWAEPFFGYYINTDTWVYRRHAYMLEAAGVDFIFLDVSNAVVFEEGHTALFDTWLKIRKEGGDTPQIAFFNGDDPKTFESNMKKLFKTVFSDKNWDKYKELFFEWEGKPLIFGNISEVSASMRSQIEDKFNIRGSWAWSDQDGYWCWMQEYTYDEKKKTYSLINGGYGRDLQGKKEALAVCLGHHPVQNKGRSFAFQKQPNSLKDDFEFAAIEQAGKGECFEYEFNAATSMNPDVLMITGWNEWIAGCFYENDSTIANTKANFAFVDQFNAEFSRDAEPMRNVGDYGFGDNYYYQLCDYIRKFKGVNETTVALNQKTIEITNISDWDEIPTVYMDSIGDTELRHMQGYGYDNVYVNGSGRNDFDYCKVSQNSNYVFFMAKTVNDIVIDDGSNWMNLYIDSDNNASTGWGGYDYCINRSRDSHYVKIEKFVDNKWQFEEVGEARYYLEGKYIVFKVQKDLIGLDRGRLASSFLFKWADNSGLNGDLMDFIDLGDTAPDSRFSFNYIAKSYTD